MDQAEMDKRFALMEANGVEMQILDICPQAPHFENKEHAVNAARKANDLYAEAVSRWPKKFKAFAAVPLPHVDEALKELERALDQLKFVGATIETFVAGRSSPIPRSPRFIRSSTGAARCCTFIRLETASIPRSMIPFNLRWAIGAPMEDTGVGDPPDRSGMPAEISESENRQIPIWAGSIPMVFQRLDNISKSERPCRSRQQPPQNACGTAA